MAALEVSRAIYEVLADHASSSPPAMRAWDGTTWGNPAAPSTIVLKGPWSLRALFLPPSDLVAAEAYVYDDVDIEGDIHHTLEFAASLAPLITSKFTTLKLVRLLRRLPAESRRSQAERPKVRGRLHTPRRDRQAVRAHYDTGNEFFELFLDPDLVYSCAYFLEPGESLATAQQRKLDVICRKLELAAGQRFLDVGCGWGALAIHAAQNYGVEATGITLSLEQAALAQQRVKEAGLEDRVTIRVQDYREASGTFDAIASIGMFEHVGRRRLATYFGRVRQLLEPGGLFLNHGITTRRPRGLPRRTFVNTYVFPDGELIPIDVVISAAEGAGLETRDLEPLRMSYALTLRQWVANLEADAANARLLTSDETYRIWRTYMAGSALAFERGDISVHQLLLAGPERPWRYGRRRLLATDDRG